MMYIYFFFFFSSRRRHTRLTCDWSSDVCSSDLVTDHGHAERQDVLHRATVEARVHHALAVVREGDAPRLRELRQLRELLTPEATRDGADRVDAHGAVLPRLGADVVGDGAVVVDGARVRHARDRREAAGRRRARPRRDGFLVLVAWLAQVHVDVDEPRADDLAASVQDLRPRRRLEVFPDALDLLAGDQHVLRAVHAVRRVDDAAVLDEEAHGAPPLL